MNDDQMTEVFCRRCALPFDIPYGVFTELRKLNLTELLCKHCAQQAVVEAEEWFNRNESQ